MDIRTASAIDVHGYDDNPDRPLYLACLLWDGERGLAGHSDGDVAAHAAADALLIATGIGELGTIFGVDQPQWENVSGTVLLREACQRVRENGWSISNLSIQIIAQKPRFSPRKEEAEAAMSAIVQAPVSVAATSTDHLGFLGRKEGIAALASALVIRD